MRADGTEFPMELTIASVDVVGPPLFIGYLRDVSEQHRQADELEALNYRRHQSERLESLGQLAGGIAHDFNNLLGVIMNYAAFAADEVADRPAVLADVQEIQSAAERAARLTAQLLILGRRGAIQPETLDLNTIVAEIHSLLSRSIGEHIELRVDPSPDLPKVRADRGQIEQVLLNLVVNARDAMPGGGTLTIETTHVELDDEYARLHPDVSAGHYVGLTVSDTGTGMSAEVAAHIFEPFFTTKAVGEGTGLGLATVYGIVTEAGGSMTVYSEEGIGTTFRLYFPVTDLPASAAPEGPALPQGQGETILVVEDEPAVLELTSRILRQGGYNVLEAATFHEALSLATSHDFHLLLTDSVMPEMSGSMLAERINELRPGRRRAVHVWLQRGRPERTTPPRGRGDPHPEAVHPPDPARQRQRLAASTGRPAQPLSRRPAGRDRGRRLSSRHRAASVRRACWRAATRSGVRARWIIVMSPVARPRSRPMGRGGWRRPDGGP